MKEDNASLIKWASEHAASLLSPLGNRWLHVQGVAERARCVGQAFNEDDYSYLLASAYLHDIGYAPSLKKIGFHPIDGACYLQAYGKKRLASLVAHHSESLFEAQLRGHAQELDKFPREQSVVADALIYCDMTTGPTGLHITFEDRIADIFHRYGDADIVSQALRQAIPSLSLAVKCIQHKLSERGLTCVAASNSNAKP